MTKHYADRNIVALDRAGNYYCRHVAAMTGEALHEKSDIAAELGHRDMIIDEQAESIRVLKFETARLSGALETVRELRSGDAQALAAVRRVVKWLGDRPRVPYDTILDKLLSALRGAP